MAEVLAEGYNVFDTSKSPSGTIKYLSAPTDVINLIQSGKLKRAHPAGARRHHDVPRARAEHGRDRRDHDVRRAGVAPRASCPGSSRPPAS